MTNQKLASISLFLIFSLLITFSTADSTVHEINGAVPDDTNYKKAEMHQESEPSDSTLTNSTQLQ